MAAIKKLIFPNTSRHSNAGRMAAELSNALITNVLSYPTSAGGAARATLAAKVKTVNTITALINGLFITGVVAADPMWTLGAAGSTTTVAASCWQKYALLLDGSGTATVQEATQSSVSADAVTWTNVSNLSAYAPYLTMLGTTKFVAASLTIATDSTHTFIPGTTALNAAGITATLADGMDQSLLPYLANQAGVIVGLGG